jgi:hypothetical protein
VHGSRITNRDVSINDDDNFKNNSINSDVILSILPTPIHVLHHFVAEQNLFESMQAIVPLQLFQSDSVTCALGVTTIVTVLLSSFMGTLTVSGRMIQLNWTSNGVREYTR